MKKSVYDIVTGQVIALLESGKTPWKQPWTATTCLPPMNYKSKRNYSGINFFLLSAKFDDPYFLSFKQAGEMGGKIKKGEKSTAVIFWLWNFYDADGKEIKEEHLAVKKVPIPRYYNVFNAAQIEGIDFSYPPQQELKPNEKIDRCETLVTATKANIRANGSIASYSPVSDQIKMPLIGQFDCSEAYYGTLFHELGHWTGHASRLDRFDGKKSAAFGSDSYSREELVAEMTACFLCHRCQIDTPAIKTNQAAYLTGWIQALRGNSKLAVIAASHAQKAADYILKSN